MHLFETLAPMVADWREKSYPSEEFPIISEILEWAAKPDFSAFHLRAPQFRALETYWYLRLIENTPNVIDLYKRCFPRTTDRLMALGLNHQDILAKVIDIGFDGLLEHIKYDDDFVRTFKLESLRESLNLDYPSYILALAMGAGKTVLIGSIFSSEFAMASEYPDGPFVQNALVFAPGKTIIESLRELAEMHYDAVLPPRFYKSFSSSLKLTFTRDGDPTIPVIPGSAFNVIVTNTEKIRIQKENIRKADLGPLFSANKEDEARTEIANLRLQAIASLPRLAIFSDEAHHTYGQALDADLKKVRKTVDYLHNPYPAGSEYREAHRTNLVCVINTTGTPYFQHQPLRDVVIWYGLSEGIRDGILKELSGNILGFDFDGDVESYLDFVIKDFFTRYGSVSLPDGTPAKLAIFFPQTDDVLELRPRIEMTLASLGQPPTLVLEHHTKNDHKTEFDRFKSKNSPHRVALLVDRGVEGWNAPCLFAVALARRLKSSNNFVLQAASRCLRQVPGNREPARIYISMDNKNILDHQLQETYDMNFAQFVGASVQTRTTTILLKKLNIPPLVVRKTIHRVVRDERPAATLKLERPLFKYRPKMEVTAYIVGETPGNDAVLRPQSAAQVINTAVEFTGLYAAADELARRYHLDAFELLKLLRPLYPGENEIPTFHLPDLAGQIEAQLCNYHIEEERVEVALALVKPEGFARGVDTEGQETYTAEISYPIDKEYLLADLSLWQAHANGLSFHYSPYNFDSKPEMNFFDQLLQFLQQHREDVEDIYFTGGLTDAHKTDFYVEYRGEDNSWHRYTPDFVIRRRDGKCLIVEIKSDRERHHPVDGEQGRKALATRKWIDLNPDLLKYEMVFTPSDEIGFEQTRTTREFFDAKPE